MPIFMPMVQIRQAEEQDLSLLMEIGTTTFRATFATSNSAEDMEKSLTEQFSAEQLLGELRTAGSRFFLALDEEGMCLGYMKLNTGRAQTEDEAPEALELQRLYVREQAHGTGVGQALFDEAIRQAEAGGHPYFWLGVWEHNPRAIRFYERNGFSIFGEHIFVLGDDPQRDLLMKRSFRGA